MDTHTGRQWRQEAWHFQPELLLCRGTCNKEHKLHDMYGSLPICPLGAIFGSLPDDKLSISRCLQKEGMLIAKQQLNSSKYTLDTFAKTITSATTLRQHAWLCTTSLQTDMFIYWKSTFDSEGLFHATTDAILQEMDKNIKASGNLSVSASS